MKILIDARFYGLEHAGLGRYTINLLKELAKIDNKNHYLVLLRKKYFDTLKFPENWKKVIAHFRHYSLAEQIKLPKIISKEKTDLVHFLHFNTPLFFKGKFVVTIHDLTMHKQGRQASTLPLPLYLTKRFLYKAIFKHSVKSSVKIIVPSEFTKKEILNNYHIDEEKIRVIYEGINEEFYSSSQAGIRERYGLTAQYFIYAGNTYPFKNLKRLIEATISVNQNQKEPVLLAIAGARDIFYQRLERDIKHLGAQRFVKLLGFVPDEDLAALYQGSVAFVYPSLTEGFGLQGLEAIAAGTLLSASDIPTFREIYKNNILYFNPYDFSSIAATMKDALVMDRGQRDEKITKGQEFIKRYSWSKMAEQTLKIYESCYHLRPGQ